MTALVIVLPAILGGLATWATSEPTIGVLVWLVSFGYMLMRDARRV